MSSEEWRPATELPKESGYVLIAGYHTIFGRKTPVVSIGRVKLYGSGPVFLDYMNDHTESITHWMPLPKHPGEVADQ